MSWVQTWTVSFTPQLIWKWNAGNASHGSASGTKLLAPATEKLTYLQESKTREKAARKEQWTSKIPKPLKSPWKGQFSQDISQLSLSTRTYSWEGFGVQSNSENIEGWTLADISPETRTSFTLPLFSCSRLVWHRPFWPQFAFPPFLVIGLSNNSHYYNSAETSKSYLKFL